MFKEHPVLIHVLIASAPISSPDVDQHLVATTDDEPIEDVNPIVPDVNLVAPDVVMDLPPKPTAKSSTSEKKFYEDWKYSNSCCFSVF